MGASFPNWVPPYTRFTMRGASMYLSEPFLLEFRVTYKTYQEYLAHPKFKAIRADAIKRVNGICVDCQTAPVTEVHHIKYPHWGTFDVPENLIPLCHACHCIRHGKEN